MNQSLQELNVPGRARLTTAAIAQADGKTTTRENTFHRAGNDFDRPVIEPDSSAEADSKADPAEPYFGESNGNLRGSPRLVTSDAADIQSAKGSLNFESQTLQDRRFPPSSDAQSPAGSGRSSTPTDSATTDNGHATPLFSTSESGSLNSRWDAVQATFVDEPRQAVQQADELVASAIQRLAEVFAQERARLEEQWDRGDSVSTEDLRVALQRYRSFFRRLLAV